MNPDKLDMDFFNEPIHYSSNCYSPKTEEYINSFGKGEYTRNVVKTIVEYFKFKAMKTGIRREILRVQKKRNFSRDDIQEIKDNVELTTIAKKSIVGQDAILEISEKSIKNVHERHYGLARIHQNLQETKIILLQLKEKYSNIITNTYRAIESARKAIDNNKDCTKLGLFCDDLYNESTYQSTLKRTIKFIVTYLIWNLNGLTPRNVTESTEKNANVKPKDENEMRVILRGIVYYTMDEKNVISKTFKEFERMSIFTANCARQKAVKLQKPKTKEPLQQNEIRNWEDYFPLRIRENNPSNETLYNLLKITTDRLEQQYKMSSKLDTEPDNYEEGEEYSFKITVPLNDEISTKSPTKFGQVACRYIFLRKSRELLKMKNSNLSELLIMNIKNLIASYLEIYETENNIILNEEFVNGTTSQDKQKDIYGPIYLPIKVYINFSNIMHDCLDLL